MVQPAPSRVVLDVAHLSDPGLDPDKQVNEDACAAVELGLGHLLVVCDGMGGHMGGKDASEAAIRTVLADVEAAPIGSNPGAVLKAAIEHAGRVVFELGGPGANLLRPGSTVVAILSHAAGSEIAHVGDSRAYVMRGDQIYPLTRDHSMVQQMIDAGVLKPSEAIGHPDANKITRALGMSPSVDVELRPSPFAHQRGDIYLLASDGLCDLVEPGDMLRVTMHAQGIEQACQQLVTLANARGGHDNITVLLAQIKDCPTCLSTQSKTFVPEEPAAMPVLRSVGGAVAPGTSAVHPTVVDEGTNVGAGMPTEGPAATWVGDDAVAMEAESDAAKRRRLLWVVVGVALILFGLALVATSIGWAMAVSAAVGMVDGRLT